MEPRGFRLQLAVANAERRGHLAVEWDGTRRAMR